jgi:hypothetical protein
MTLLAIQVLLFSVYLFFQFFSMRSSVKWFAFVVCLSYLAFLATFYSFEAFPIQDLLRAMAPFLGIFSLGSFYLSSFSSDETTDKKRKKMVALKVPLIGVAIGYSVYQQTIPLSFDTSLVLVTWFILLVIGQNAFIHRSKGRLPFRHLFFMIILFGIGTLGDVFGLFTWSSILGLCLIFLMNFFLFQFLNYYLIKSYLAEKLALEEAH